ncbi:MAG TPA: histidine phosphatase family protein [Rhizomicrobium sp.]|nr:histidine phosphatase family protein [Rhizomicrobium sp.]
MKRLLLLRHAKAEAQGEARDDKSRALTERGRQDAARIALHMRKKQYLPDFVMCSSSVRTRETLEYWSVAIAENPKTQFFDALYLAEPETMLSLIRRAPDTAQAMMIVAHNPGTEEIAIALLREQLKPKARDQLDAIEEKFPTAALAIIDFDIDSWKALKTTSGSLVDFVRPRDLRDGSAG